MILFSLAELFAGLMLMAGFMTRGRAASAVFSILLMLMFGWQGATCIDEWTMAACNLAMGATLMLAGSGAYSLDNSCCDGTRRLPNVLVPLDRRALPLPMTDGFRNLGLAVLAATAAFNVATYDHYRGSVYSPSTQALSARPSITTRCRGAVLQPDGGVRFHLYLDGGTPEAPSHIVGVALLGAGGKVLRQWDMATLSHLPAASIINDFAYNKIETAPFGLTAEMGAMATITLPGQSSFSPADAPSTLQITTVSGKHFETHLQGG